MTQIILPLVISFLLLGITTYWLLQANPSHKIESSEARDALVNLRSKFLPATLVDRIFDSDDLVFARHQENRNILRLLEAERKTIALYWLRHTQRQVRLLRTFYVKAARQNPKLSAALEFKLAFSYLAFWVTCNALLALIWLRGPFHARDVARRTMVVAARFCTISEGVSALAEIDYTKMQESSGDR